MNTAYLLLGSNEGDRKLWLKMATDMIDIHCGLIVKKSAVYKTAAWGIIDQPEFLNMVVCVKTDKKPNDLLDAILNIERALGRERNEKWGRRKIDIDILFYNDEIIDIPGLVIPHPYIQERKFTLVPLAEIAPTYMHPVIKKTVQSLLDNCPDNLAVVNAADD